MRSATRRTLLLLVGGHVVVAILGVITGFLLLRDLPGIQRLDVMNLSRVTVLEDRHGEKLHTFAEQRRIPVSLDRIDPLFLKAVIATEDPRFMRHFGVDAVAVVRAAIKNLTTHWGSEGASTITMQLARDEFLHPRKTLYRKALEAVYATQIEHHYSKQTILTHYCNRVYLGHGHWGVEAAARYYFDKAASDLELHQAALLAGLIQAPERLTPHRHPDRATSRRNHVLERMVIEGVLDRESAEKAKKAPLDVVEPRPTATPAPYFVEDVRRWLVRQYGDDAVYREGLRIKTTLEPKLQRAAERAVAMGLDDYGRRHGQLPQPAPLPEDETPETYEHPAWYTDPKPGTIIPAVVISVEADLAVVRIADQELRLGRDQIDWTGEDDLSEVLEAPSIVRVRVREVGGDGRVNAVDLASEPSAQAALVAVDAATGHVLAMVGGRDFQESEYNRATQAPRQPGSAFKPFIFAAALEKGFLPNDLLLDAPTVIVDAGTEPYQPDNYERDYKGYVTLRHALEHSRNIPTVRLLDAVGYDPAVAMARRLGIASDLEPFPSLALGAFEVELIDLVSAYAAFVNGGVLVEPKLVRSVEHSDQRQLFEAQTEAREVLSPEISGMMVSLLEGVVLRGTGRGVRSLNRPLGGKTGTTDGFTDAWFVGFTPSMAVGVWVGHDQRRSLGRKETGARAALPIWREFLDDGLGDEDREGEFLRPPGLRRVLIDSLTGLRVRSGAPCQDPILEIFPRERLPDRVCNERDNLRHELPYPLQPHPLTPEMELQMPPDDAAHLVAESAGRFRLERGARSLAWSFAEDHGRIRLDWQPRDVDRFFELLPQANQERQLRRWDREDFVEEFEESLEDLPPNEEPPKLEDVLPARFRRGLDDLPARILEANRSGRVRWPSYPIDPES
jgi:penicillin-binding protein 1A